VEKGMTHHTAAELAYLGDAVFELLVREKLLREGIPFRSINRRAKSYVSAQAQSEMYHKIFPALSPNEQAVAKRGRNLHNCSRSKNAGVAEYRHATGLEALFGHLHQNGEIARIHELFELCTGDMSRYLESTDIIDFDTSPEIKALANELTAQSEDEAAFVKNAFEYVRDKISHSADINGNVITCKASEVLREKQGICYAKSHLLEAILRCRKIPAGFCYQQLILDDETAPVLILHGLNTVFINKKWIRLDARGNKPGVNAQFSLSQEQLAFPVRPEKGEKDIPVVFAAPDKNIITALITNKDINALWRNLPTTLEMNYD
jgi:23S rRNA maturation mini-RNase III